MKKPEQVIIFDWDGTLMDSQAHITECMHAAISACAMPPRSDAEIAGIIGLSLNGAFAALYDDLDSHKAEQLAAAYRRHFFLNEELPSPLFAEAEALLRELHQQGLYLAVATGKSRRGLDQALAQSGLADCFHLSRTADETASKPDPLMLHEILTDLDLPASRAVMIGDALFDIEMARQANMFSIGVGWGTQTLAQLQQAGADRVAESFADLRKHLQQFTDIAL